MAVPLDAAPLDDAHPDDPHHRAVSSLEDRKSVV